jgi:hypothetical protein
LHLPAHLRRVCSIPLLIDMPPPSRQRSGERPVAVGTIADRRHGRSPRGEGRSATNVLCFTMCNAVAISIATSHRCEELLIDAIDRAFIASPDPG